MFTYHIQFEDQYDETPVIRVYPNYLEDGEWNTDFETMVDRYEFKDEDVDFTLAAFGYKGIEELRIDEYYQTEDVIRHQNWLSPGVTKFILNHTQANA